MGKKICFFILAIFVLPYSYAVPGYVRPDKIIMVWDYIGRMEDNPASDVQTRYNGLDVVSPTWFSVSDKNGNISSFADSDYVRRAHDNSIKVWALFENGSDDLRTFMVLSDGNKRKKIVEQIAAYAVEYGLDGINIDFESMSRITGAQFEKFTAELYEKLKPLNVTLSVDIPLDADYTDGIYDINLIAANCDFIVLMAYDQYHAKSELPGPVAAIGWVKQGIEDILQYVPSEKIILGIPFFTRIWVESCENGIYKKTSSLRGMKESYEWFDKNARIWGRDRATEQIYAEYETGQKRCKAWLEDDHSISLKLDAVNDYDLAGLSAWRSGWELPDIWDLINAYFE